MSSTDRMSQHEYEVIESIEAHVEVQLRRVMNLTHGHAVSAGEAEGLMTAREHLELAIESLRSLRG